MSTDMKVKVLDQDKLLIRAMCTVTKQPYQVTVDYKAWKSWQEGHVRIQDAFPDMTASQREFIMSGTTPDEWIAWMGVEE